MNADFASLNELFGQYGLPTVVSDCSYVLNRFEESGLKAIDLEMVSAGVVEAPISVLLVPAAPSHHPNKELLCALEKSAVLVVPLLAFAAGPREVDYLIRRLSNLSFEDACERNLSLVEYVQHAEAPITVESSGCRLVVELGDNVDIMIPKVSPEITVGEWISIIQYLEVGLVPNAENSSFLVNGTLLCEGVTIAHHLHSHFRSGPLAAEVWRYLEGLRSEGRFPLVLNIENSKLCSILTRDGIEILDHILPLTDETKRGGLTEVAFGALVASDETDWSVNSQLNEPAGGFHVGIGVGDSGAHIDFISPNAKCS